MNTSVTTPQLRHQRAIMQCISRHIAAAAALPNHHEYISRHIEAAAALPNHHEYISHHTAAAAFARLLPLVHLLFDTAKA